MNMTTSDLRTKKTENRPDDEEIVSPNRPHQSLEYPLLFFLLKRWPWLFDKIKYFYMFRWSASYPLQKKIPGSQSLRKLGIHLTWGEALLLIPFWIALIAAAVYTVIYPNVTNTGHVARTGLISCFVFAQRNSLVTLLLGMPIDRSLFYHKLSGRVAMIGTVAHAYAFFIDPKFQRKNAGIRCKLASMLENTMNTSGTFMTVMVCGIILTSLPYFRRRVFEFFYYLHIVFVSGIVLGALFHTGILVPLLATSTWGVDLFLRSIVMARHRYPRKANIRVLSDTVVELSFPKVHGFDYNPGQYIYISLPDISCLQWHPFSISSAPKMKNVTLHIRKTGNWTGALYELAKKKKEVSILMEGPYGSLGVNLVGDRYKMVMLVSGGIGITPMQSICDQLLFEQARERRNLKHVKFIWTDRDPIMMQEAPVVQRSNSVIAECSKSSMNFKVDQPIIDMSLKDECVSVDERNSALIFSQLLALLPPGQATDKELEDLYESLDVIMELDAQRQQQEAGESLSTKAIEDLVVGSKGEDVNSGADQTHGYGTTVADNLGPWHYDEEAEEKLGDILDMQLYLTGQNQNNIPNARTGRPDFKAIFLEMKELAKIYGEKRIAVCVCAPPKLSNICRKACIVYSDAEVRFDFHTESMEG